MVRAEHHGIAQGDRGGYPDQARGILEDCDTVHREFNDGCATDMNDI